MEMAAVMSAPVLMAAIDEWMAGWYEDEKAEDMLGTCDKRDVNFTCLTVNRFTLWS